MIVYHGTSKENWKLIQKEGIIHGIIPVYTDNTYTKVSYYCDRCTYLAIDKEEAEQYGEVVLTIDYTPQKSNYVEGCWQFREYDPIDVSHIVNVEENKKK